VTPRRSCGKIRSVADPAARIGASTVIHFEVGEYFFHYTSRDAAFEHILPERRLRLSPYARMRDPLEAKAPNFGAAMTVPPNEVEVDEMNHVWFEARELVGRKRAEAKLLSLTIDATDYKPQDEMFGRGYARARMWEQYAEKHQGVCLVFERAGLTALVEKQIDERGSRACAGPVRYSRTGLLGTGASTLMPTQGITGAQLAAEHLAQNVGPLFLLKLIDWQSEHEFRFVELADGNEYTYVDFGDTLRAVVLGDRFPGWQIYGAIEMCRPLDAELWQMAWELNRPLPLKPRLPDGRIVEPDGTVTAARGPFTHEFTHEDLGEALGGESE
jgi:Protein of unknown function (DUF2971)